MRKPLPHELQLDYLVPAGAELVSIDSPAPGVLRVIGDGSEGVSVLKIGIRWTPQKWSRQSRSPTLFDAHDRVDE